MALVQTLILNYRVICFNGDRSLVAKIKLKYFFIVNLNIEWLYTI